MRNVVILGSGPAGLTAALYTARALLEPLVVEGVEAGGQLMLTTGVENYPGFPEGIQGPELIDSMKRQAMKFGAEFVPGNATAVDVCQRPFKVEVEDKVFETKALIIAMGASANLLGLESERALLGHGVSTCATCDGFFFRNEEVMVVGGGDSAIEEAIFLTRFASKVTVIHRRDQLRASKIMQQRALDNEKIGFIWDSVVDEILDVNEGKVVGVGLRNVKTGEVCEHPCTGLFIAIGYTPSTGLFKGQLELDEKGHIVLGYYSHTSVPGVFAAGDVSDFRYRQVATAVGSGCRAAIDAEKWLDSIP